MKFPAFRPAATLRARVECEPMNPVLPFLDAGELLLRATKLEQTNGGIRCNRRRRSAWLCVLLFVVTALGLASNATHAIAASEIASGTRLFIEQQILPGGEVEVAVGDPDPRLQLAPCARFEPFIPPNAKLWGRTSLGVRCVEGASWTIYLPVQVRVFAPVLVASRPLPRGHVLGPDDARPERLDLTQLKAPSLGADDGIQGLVAVRPIAAGEALRRDIVKAPPAISPGDAVRVVIDGPGFAVATDGRALSAAADGESARVATANGRVLTGVARPGKVVAVR